MKRDKKRSKKLFLSKVTIARLDVVRMDKIYGGVQSSTPDTKCGACGVLGEG